MLSFSDFKKNSTVKQRQFFFAISKIKALSSGKSKKNSLSNKTIDSLRHSLLDDEQLQKYSVAKLTCDLLRTLKYLFVSLRRIHYIVPSTIFDIRSKWKPKIESFFETGYFYFPKCFKKAEPRESFNIYIKIRETF